MWRLLAEPIPAVWPGSEPEAQGVRTEFIVGTVTVADRDIEQEFVQPETNVVDDYQNLFGYTARAWTLPLNDDFSGVQALKPGRWLIPLR